MATTKTFASTPDVSFTSDGDTDASTNRNICGIISMLESPAAQREKREIDDGLLATQPIEILKGNYVNWIVVNVLVFSHETAFAYFKLFSI